MIILNINNESNLSMVSKNRIPVWLECRRSWLVEPPPCRTSLAPVWSRLSAWPKWSKGYRDDVEAPWWEWRRYVWRQWVAWCVNGHLFTCGRRPSEIQIYSNQSCLKVAHNLSLSEWSSTNLWQASLEDTNIFVPKLSEWASTTQSRPKIIPKLSTYLPVAGVPLRYKHIRPRLPAWSSGTRGRGPEKLKLVEEFWKIEVGWGILKNWSWWRNFEKFNLVEEFWNLLSLLIWGILADMHLKHWRQTSC